MPAAGRRRKRRPSIAPLRIAVIDMGSNSTRLLVAEVEGGRVDALHRESRVTRLGRGVETAGRLGTAGIEQVCAAVGDYVSIAADLEVERDRRIRDQRRPRRL